ncbi:hypothetical protein FRC12_007388 [Ceratobasidium sp. 428]|nr:hypothetical protein FRC12_007388 [Ceratobasidium sp. 428]
MNPEASSSQPAEWLSRPQKDRFFPHTEGANIKLLAQGAVANVWLYTGPMSTQEDSDPRGRPSQFSPPMKLVSKSVRISPESMIFYRCGPSSQSTKDDMWRNFVQDYQDRTKQWCEIKHENVIRVVGFVEVEGLNLIEEFCAYGTLRERRWPTSLDVYNMVHGVVTGLRHLHELEPPVIHGGLNAGKVYITDNNVAKLGEFSLAMLIQGFATLVPTVSCAGICRFMSPELFDNGDEMVFTKASDIWALGCTLYEALSGQLPYSDFKHDVEVVYRIKAGIKPGYHDEQQTGNLPYLWPIVEACWSTLPEERPSSYEVLTKQLRQRGTSALANVTINTDGPYLDKLQTWAQNLQLELSWDYTRSVRSAGLRPIWIATPIMQTIRLTTFAGKGATKSAAQADAAEMFMTSDARNYMSQS